MPKQSASLAEHWGPADLNVPTASLEDLRAVLGRAPRSALGPDGIAYAHLAQAGDFAARTLHEAYLAVLGGIASHDGFNDARLGFIPKAALQLGKDEHRALPKELRPLTLGNTSHKASMRLVNGTLEQYASAVVHPSQTGFVRGRDMLTNVAEIEGSITGFLHDDEAEPAAILLDVAVAFPSADWGYIRRALRALGVPRTLIDALFAMYGPTRIEI